MWVDALAKRPVPAKYAFLIYRCTTVDAVMLIIWGAVEPATIIIAASLPELRGYVWRHPKPIRYRCEDSVHRRRGLTEEDYDYARRQYANAGRKTLGDRSESMEAVDVRHSAFWI